MATNTLNVEPLHGSAFGLIADAHIHPGAGPALPAAVLDAFRGVDAIIALGDMGESAGLDELATVAPVLGVRGEDDAADDPRVAAERRLFSHGGRFIGALFDGARHGLFNGNDPFVAAPQFAAVAAAAFGQPVSILLCAGTHRPLLAWSDGILIVNPGSPTLADRCSVAILHLASDHARVEHVAV